MANEDYKNGKLVEIVREFNNTGNQYEVNGIKQAIAVPFWRRENDKFQVIPKGSYSFINEAGNDYLKILDSTILQQATQFQIVYDYLQLSSKYIEDFPDVVILTEKYNQLVDDTSNIFSYLKSVGMTSDTLQLTKVLAQLEPLTTWYMDENEEIKALPISDLYGKFNQMVEALKKEFEKVLIAGADEALIEIIKKFKEETDKQLGILAGAGSAFKPKQVANIEILKNVNAKVDEVYEVLGYYRFDDGANHKRIIAREDDGSGVQLNNGLWANILFDGNIYVEYLGAKGDGTTDDTQAIQKAIDNYSKVSFKNKTYILNGSINISYNTKRDNVDIYFNDTSLSLKGEVRDYAFAITSQARIYGKFWLFCWSLARVGLIHSSSGANNRNYLDTVRVSDPIYIGIALTSWSFFGLTANNINFSVYNQLITSGCGKKQIDITTESTMIERGKIKIPGYTVKHDIEKFAFDFGLVVMTYNYSNSNLKITRKVMDITYDDEGAYILIPQNFTSPYDVNKKINKITITVGCSIFNSGRDANCLVINNIDSSKSKVGLLTNASYGSTINYFSSQADAISAIIGPGGGSLQMGFLISNVYLENFGLNGIIMYSTNKDDVKISQWNRDHTRIVDSNGVELLPTSLNFWNFSPIDYVDQWSVTDKASTKFNSRVIYSLGNSTVKVITLTKDRNEFEFVLMGVQGKITINITSEDTEYLFLKNSSNTIAIKATSDSAEKCVILKVYKHSSTKKITYIFLKGSEEQELAQLNTIYMSEKMKQEGVYNDYISYLDEKTLYDKERKKIEEQRQLAYEQALQENPELTYEEFLSMQPMTLNLLVAEEPQPSEPLKKFMEKYL